MTLVAVRLAVLRTAPAARALFLASVLYLPALSGCSCSGSADDGD